MDDVHDRMPALYIGHGAPPLLDDPLWSGQLAQWAQDLPRPTAILIVSAHWESAPVKIMYPAGDIPVLQMSLPTQDPQRLLELGKRLQPLRDEGVLIIGSGFL